MDTFIPIYKLIEVTDRIIFYCKDYVRPLCIRFLSLWFSLWSTLLNAWSKEFNDLDYQIGEILLEEQNYLLFNNLILKIPDRITLAQCYL